MDYVTDDNFCHVYGLQFISNLPSHKLALYKLKLVLFFSGSLHAGQIAQAQRD